MSDKKKGSDNGVTWEIIDQERGRYRRFRIFIEPKSETSLNPHKFPTEVRYADDYDIERDIWENGVKRTIQERVEKGKTYYRPVGTVHVVRNVSDDRPLNFEKDEFQIPPGLGQSSEGEPDD